MSIPGDRSHRTPSTPSLKTKAEVTQARPREGIHEAAAVVLPTTVPAQASKFQEDTVSSSVNTGEWLQALSASKTEETTD